jgi:hypothetical protein
LIPGLLIAGSVSLWIERERESERAYGRESDAVAGTSRQ